MKQTMLHKFRTFLIIKDFYKFSPIYLFSTFLFMCTCLFAYHLNLFSFRTSYICTLFLFTLPCSPSSQLLIVPQVHYLQNANSRGLHLNSLIVTSLLNQGEGRSTPCLKRRPTIFCPLQDLGSMIRLSDHHLIILIREGYN